MGHKRLLLKILLIITLAIIVSLWYVNKFILPVKAKALLTDFLKAQTGRNVTLGGLSYNPLKGLVIQNLAISDDEAAGAKEFLSVKEVSVNFLIIPFFKEKKIIIPSATIKEPRVFLSLDSQKRWNFES